MTYEGRRLSQGFQNRARHPSALATRSLPRPTRHVNNVFQFATWGALIALTLVAFLLRAPYLDTQSLWRDEVDVIRLANLPLSRLISNLFETAHNGPLYYLLMRGWLSLVGESEFALRYLSLCFGVMTVALGYQAGREMIGRRAAVMSAALIAISPYLVWYSQDAKMYALVTALTLLALICQLKALASGQLRWWAGFVVFASLSLYIHLLSALMILVYVGAFLLAWPRRRQRRWRGLVSLGLLTLPYVPLAAWQYPLVLNTYETGHPFYPIGQILSLLFNLYSRGTAMVGGWVAVAAFVFAILGGLFSTAGERAPTRVVDNRLLVPGRIRTRLFLLVWLLLPIAVVYLISLRAPVFEPRYLIFVGPAFYLLAALGMVALSRLSWAAAGSALVVILSFSLLGVWVQATSPIKSDFRAAAYYLMIHRQDEAPILFQMPYVRHTFDYYFASDYVALDGPWTNDGVTEAQVADAMTGLLGDYPDVWLVASESWLWDSRGLTKAWFDQNTHLIESASFSLVDVYHYDLTNGQD